MRINCLVTEYVNKRAILSDLSLGIDLFILINHKQVKDRALTKETLRY